jgi:Glycosyl hydrolase family 99
MLLTFICALRPGLARTRSCRRDRTICRCALVGVFVVVTSFNSMPRVAGAASVAPEVLAFHYGWYGNPQVSGERRHWKNVDPINQRIENETDFPVYGAYDSHDPAVVDRQAEVARGAGITGFIASWWGRDSFEDRGMPLLLAVAGKHKLSISTLRKNCGRGYRQPHQSSGGRHRLSSKPLRQRQGMAADQRKAGCVRLRPRFARAFACRLAGHHRPGAARQPGRRPARRRFT